MTWKEKIETFGIAPVGNEEFTPLNNSEIQEIEELVSAELPVDYKEFLLTYGASDFDEFVGFSTPDGPVYPGTFIGKRLVELIKKYENRLPSQIIPINDDGANNLICLSLRKDSFGAIFFQSHSFGWDPARTDVDAAKLEVCPKITCCFSNFILGLEIE